MRCRSILVAAVAVVHFLAAMGSEALAVTVNYVVTTGTGDNWAGTFDIPDMNATLDADPSSVSTISVTSGTTSFSFSPDYYGSNADGLVSWSYIENIDSFDIYSTSLYDMIGVGATWSDVVAVGTFALRPSPYDTQIYAASGAGGALSGSGGTISFVIAPVPEPSTYAMVLAGAGLLGLFRLSRRRSRPAGT